MYWYESGLIGDKAMVVGVGNGVSEREEVSV